MEYLFHIGPEFAFGPRRERFEELFADVPPFPGSRVSGHFGHIRIEIIADVLKVAEHHIVLVIDRIVSDIALLNHPQNVGPDIRVETLIFFEPVRLNLDHHSVTSHRFSPNALFVIS